MKYSLILATILISPLTFSSTDYMPYLGRDMERVNVYNPKKSNWVTSFGFEGQGLPVERSFQGQGKSFQDKNELLMGARLGIGRDFYLGAGFNTRTQLDGYFVGTIFEPKKAVTGEDSSASNSFTQKQGNIFGGEISQVLSFITEFNAPVFIGEHKIKMYFEPFIEAGIGIGKSVFRFDYRMKTSTLDEEYRKVMDNTFISQRLSVGMNFISKSGYFLTLKASQVAHQISDSKSYEMAGNGGALSRRDIDQKNDTINLSYSYYLGGGYKW